MLVMIAFSCAISVGLIWATNALARSQYWGSAGACVFAAVATVPFLCFSPALALQSALTFLFLLLVRIGFRGKPNAVLTVSILAMVGSYGFFLRTGYKEIQKLSKLRAENPLVSVAGRLRYETKAADALARPEEDSQPPELNPEVEKRLNMTDGGSFGIHGNFRQYSLRNLHYSISDEFVMARGFGPVRMAGVQAERVELPNSPAIPLPSAPSPEADYDFEHGSAAPVVDQAAINATPPRNDLLAMHDSGIEDFLESERMGFVKDRDHVAGFVSHRFTKMPGLAVPKDQPPASWKIIRLELVSLLKHDTPMAYVSKNLPQMDELRDAPTRPLDPFEQRSLDSLSSDEDVMIDETPDRIRMIGSLRAGKSCLECHSVHRGDLLGALTYELVPAKTTRKKGPQLSPPSS